MISLRRLVYALAAMCAIAPASLVSAQESAVLGQLADLMEEARRQGLEHVYRELGALNDGQNVSFQFYAPEQDWYTIVGVCDNDCSDLNLHLRASWGIAEDMGPSDVPRMALALYPNIHYTVQVQMEVCRVEPCNWGVQILKGYP